MATLLSTSLHISCLFSSSPHKPNKIFPFSINAVDPQKDSSDPDADSPPLSPEPAASDPAFESRLSQVRLRYRTGRGKKAELRKAKKAQSSSKKGAASVFLPPVPLKDPISGGLKVDFGFSPYTERLNGRVAIIGLAALLLVELGSGQSLISYHTPPILFVQLYFVAAVSALFVKYEKEKISVWPAPMAKK